MKKQILWIVIALVLSPLSVWAATPTPNNVKTGNVKMSTAQNAFDYSFIANDGSALPLSKYKGNVLLVVNTASRCGFTPQYEGLQAIYNKYKDKGLVVLAVPSNNFGGQEPGTASEIKEFTQSKFNISFPLTATTSVTGSDIHPFYAWAKEQNVGGFANTTPNWNFHKYLVGRNGQLLESFASMTKPESKDMIDAIENALAEK